VSARWTAPRPTLSSIVTPLSFAAAFPLDAGSLTMESEKFSDGGDPHTHTSAVKAITWAAICATMAIITKEDGTL